MEHVEHDLGFGLIPRRVMRDERLSIGAKVVYAYLASFAGNKEYAFPGRDLMCNELGISKDSLLKYMRLLKEFGYLEVEQVKEGGRFAHNIYKLIPYPNSSDTEISSPYPKISDTVEKDTNNNNNINNNNYKYKEVIDYLNERTGKNYKPVETNNKLIRARYKEGYTLEDFKAVIDYKTSKWKGTEWEKYLRPSTLFGNKFETYVNEIPNRSIECTKAEEVDEGEFTNFLDIMKKGGLE